MKTQEREERRRRCRLNVCTEHVYIHASYMYIYIYIWKRMRLVTSKRVQSGEESRIDGQTGRTVTEDEGNGDERGLCTLA